MSGNLIYIAATVIASLAAVGSFYYGRRQSSSSDKDEARNEAIDLANIRGSIVAELRRRLDAIEDEQLNERDTCAQKIDELHNTIQIVREEHAESVRMLAVTMRGALVKVLSHLESEPPESDEAIAFLRDALSQEAPPAPSPWRVRRRTT